MERAAREGSVSSSGHARNKDIFTHCAVPDPEGRSNG